jgi:hypothetical protein
MAAKPVPDGYHTVTPYLTVRGAPKVVEFLEQRSGRKYRMSRSSGRMERSCACR